MGGDVTLERTGGPGATFTLRLPAAASAPVPAAPRVVDAGAGNGPENAAEEIRRASAGRGLKAAGESLMRQVEETVQDFVRRARADAALGFTDEMSDVDVADHLGTLVIDVANSLAILAHAGGEPNALLTDGSRIQRVIGELHGAQRQRLGWTEAQLDREVTLVREVCLKALDQSLGDDPHAREAAVSALERLLDERTRACISGFRGSVATS
jgi:hypothetical protein